MIQQTHEQSFEEFAAQLVQRNEEHLIDYGSEEQVARVVTHLERFSRQFPLRPVHGTSIDLAGFGQVPVRFETDEYPYVLLSEVAKELGWSLPSALRWAEKDHGFALYEQRDQDEQRGDGRLGWECLDGCVDLGLVTVLEDPEAKPDRYGGRWSSGGDWLISHDRMYALMLDCPWGREFRDNIMPALRRNAHQIWGRLFQDVRVQGPDGLVTGDDAVDTLFKRSDGLTDEEALRRARRGPSLEE